MKTPENVFWWSGSVNILPSVTGPVPAIWADTACVPCLTEDLTATMYKDIVGIEDEISIRNQRLSLVSSEWLA